MLSELLTWLEGTVRAALPDVAVLKGYPTWDRPRVAPPLVAVVLETVGPMPVPGRIGQAQATLAATFRLIVYGRDEPDMTVMVEAVLGVLRGCRITIGDGQVQILAGEGGRQVPETPAQQEQHAFGVLINAAWSA